MATNASPAQPLDLSEQIARIDKMQAELGKIQVEIIKTGADTTKVERNTRFAPLTLAFTGIGAGAAIFAAGAAFAKLFT